MSHTDRSTPPIHLDPQGADWRARLSIHTDGLASLVLELNAELDASMALHAELESLRQLVQDREQTIAMLRLLLDSRFWRPAAPLTVETAAAIGDLATELRTVLQAATERRAMHPSDVRILAAAKYEGMALGRGVAMAHDLVDQGVEPSVVRRIMAAIVSPRLPAELELPPGELDAGRCSHPGAAGSCMPRVRDGRCVWCERVLPRAGQA